MSLTHKLFMFFFYYLLLTITIVGRRRRGSSFARDYAIYRYVVNKFLFSGRK